MPCPAFEDLLTDYAELTPAERQRVDAHLHSCPECRSWLDALTEIDAALIVDFGDVRAPVTLAPSLRRQITRPLLARVSVIPEVLDFLGWLGVIGATGVLAYFMIPPTFALSTSVLFAVSGILLCVALSVTVWALRGSES